MFCLHSWRSASASICLRASPRATPLRRDALVAEATTEFGRDMTDETIATNCAQLDEMPAETSSAWADAMNACLDAAECGAFAECD